MDPIPDSQHQDLTTMKSRTFHARGVALPNSNAVRSWQQKGNKNC
jgi:hypothetical protein